MRLAGICEQLLLVGSGGTSYTGRLANGRCVRAAPTDGVFGVLETLRIPGIRSGGGELRLERLVEHFDKIDLLLFDIFLKGVSYEVDVLPLSLFLISISLGCIGSCVEGFFFFEFVKATAVLI